MALQSNVWQQFKLFKNPRLVQLSEDLPQLLQNVRSENTLTAYSQTYKRFELWADNFNDIPSYPTNEYAVALYIMHLIQENKTMSSVQQFIAATAWIHRLGGHKVPTENNIVQNVMDSAKRRYHTPVVHKTPVTRDMLVDLHNSMFQSEEDKNLVNLRDFTYILISFKGFLRFSEASQIRREHLVLHYDYIDMYIPRSKTDQLANGKQVLIAPSSGKLCALTWLTRFLVKAKIQNSHSCYIFRSIFHIPKQDKWGLRLTDKPLSYSTLSDMFRKRIAQTQTEQANVTFHSLRAGGVTLAAQNNVPKHLFKQHGR